LLVDDELLVKHSFVRVLRCLGYELITVSHATEAIELVARRPELDLVITDVVMPDLNGVQLIERLSELGVKAKVLYVSGFADGLLNNRAGLGDRVEFLAKPVGVRQLEDKVRELLQEGPVSRSEAVAGQ
jgi:two-component system cell cycle sensor histidine kinase/response regulator CckA